MKEVKAFIKPNRVQKVVEALKEAGFKSMTISTGEGTGTYESNDAKISLDFHITNTPVVKLELVCQHQTAQKAIAVIMEHARTHERGNGIIYLSEVENAFKIKTGKSLKTETKDGTQS